MSEISFNLEGLDELQKDLSRAVTFYPDEAEKALKSLGRSFCKDAKSNAKKNYNHLDQKWWKKRVENNLGDMSLIIINSSNTHHLLENGHHKWLFGKDTGGWVPGQHYTEKTRQSWESSGKVGQELDKVCKKVFKKVNL